MKNNKDTKECCEKCYEVILVTQTSSANEKVITFEQIQCSNEFCPCHTRAPKKKDTSWEERWDKDYDGWMHRDGAKDFIKQEIQKAKEDTIKEVIEKYIAENRQKVERTDRYVLDDLLTLLKQKIK